MHLAHLAYLAGPNPFGHAFVPFEGIALVSHLRGYFILLRQFCEQPCFVYRVCERFLKVHVLAESHCVGCDNGVVMVGSGYHYGVDAFSHSVEHFPPIFEAFCFWEVVESFHCILPVNVAEGHDVFGFHVLHVAASDAAHAYAGYVEFVAGRSVSVSLAEHIARHDGDSSCAQQAVFKELSSCYILHDYMSLGNDFSGVLFCFEQVFYAAD